MRGVQSRFRRLRMEHLEDRRLLADIDWVGGISDDWHVAGNWNPATVPDNGDVAVFDAGALAVKLYANQVKDVTLSFDSGTTTLFLNGFEFTYGGDPDGIRVGKAANAATATIQGPGKLVIGPPPAAPNIVVGAGSAEAELTFIGLEDIQFNSLLIGATAAPGFATIQDSTAHGRNIVVGNRQVQPQVEWSDLGVTQAEVVLIGDLNRTSTDTIPCVL